jgi:hypothetical protein
MATSDFGKAFREARASGDKTFTFNGKKYTTELAEDKRKKEMSAAKDKAMQDENKPAGYTGQDDRGSFDMGAYKARREPNALSEVTKPGTNTNYENKDVSDMSMKRGGKVKKMASGGSASSRADGIASRGKTRGKMC